MADYWKLREIKERERLLDLTINKLETQLVQEYRRLSNKIYGDMREVFDKIVLNGDNVLASDLYKYNKYYELLNNINIELEKSGQKIINIYNNKFYSLYKKNSLLVGKQFNLSTEINEQQAIKAINSVWVNDGLNWSDRIWTNQKVLADKLQKGLVQCISAGYTSDMFKSEIMKIFNVSYSSADRIARTELSYIYNKSTIDKYRECGVKKYKFLATADERECSKCQELNGKIFELDNLILPVHPNCRCTVLAVLEKEKDK